MPRVHIMKKIKMSTLIVNQRGYIQAGLGQGTSQPPKNMSVANEVTVMRFAYSDRAKIAKRMPVYSV